MADVRANELDKRQTKAQAREFLFFTETVMDARCSRIRDKSDPMIDGQSFPRAGRLVSFKYLRVPDKVDR